MIIPRVVTGFAWAVAATMAAAQLDAADGARLLSPTGVFDTLKVNVIAYAKEVRVQALPFPDYVFAPGYRLMPLSEVEAVIRRDGHLPGVPTAATIEKEGLPVSAMLVKQMEKIEELTLHAIDLDRRNRTLAAENEILRTRLDRIEQALRTGAQR